MKNKKVSIIVPLFKSEPFLNLLVDSILNQTYQNIELVLVDDESPDRCGVIADEYACTDSRVIVIHQKNQGCCGARNSGLKVVTGDYLMFADGDDWMESDCVEYLVDLLENNNCQMSMTDGVFTPNTPLQPKRDRVRVVTNEDAACQILYMQIPVGPWNKLYDLKMIKEKNLSFSVPWFGEGLFFSVMAAQYSESVAIGHRKVYHYRLDNPNSGTTIKEVQHAVNASKNIHYIKEQLIIRTKRTEAAADWHIITNCLMMIDYIRHSRNPKMYKDLEASAVQEYRKLCPIVIKTSPLDVQSVFRYLKLYISPVMFLHLEWSIADMKEKIGWNRFKYWIKKSIIR